MACGVLDLKTPNKSFESTIDSMDDLRRKDRNTKQEHSNIPDVGFP